MDSLIIERSNGVVTLTLNRPQRKNAITGEMWDGMTELFVEVAKNRDDRVLVITGAGDGFCSGADLGAAFDARPGAGVGNAIDGMRRVSNAALRLHELPKPTIAAVNGIAAGAGCNLALGCDLVVASRDARFSEIFMRRGLVPDFGGTWLLPRLIGLHRAKELVFLGDVISAEEADRIGLVNHVVEPEALMSTAGKLARRLAAMPPVQLGIAKRMLHQSLSVSMAEALESETVTQTAMFGSSDTAEAVSAFLEKREPKFTGN